MASINGCFWIMILTYFLTLIPPMQSRNAIASVHCNCNCTYLSKLMIYIVHKLILGDYQQEGKSKFYNDETENIPDEEREGVL